MKMKIFIPIMMLLFCMGFAAAATVVNQDPAGNLANATYQTSSSITYGINVTGNQTSWKCYLYTNENGSNSGTYGVVVTGATVANNTNYNFPVRTSVADAAGVTAYNWSVKCNATTDPAGDWTTSGSATQSNFTYGVDATAPVVTLYWPSANKVWYTTGSDVRIGMNVTDTNAASCVLGTNLNVSGNTTGTFNSAAEIYAYTTTTAFNFTSINETSDWADIGTTSYLYQYVCNDSAGNTASLGSNYTFYVDSTAPSAFDWNSSLFKTNNVALWNATTATDYTPQAGWNITTELNFSRYQLTFYNASVGGYNNTLGDRRVNVTTKTTLSANITALLADESYIIEVTAYDLAGNAVNITSKLYNYTTTSTNRALKAGWNIVGNIGNAFTLSTIMNYTGATTTSYWNSTHEFQSHVAGGSYGTTSIAAGEPVLLYFGADTIVSDLVWNTTAIDPDANGKDVTNSSDSSDNSNWNLVMQKAAAAKDLQSIDNYVNCNSVGAGCASGANNATNVDYMSLYNNSASTGAKYISYVANFSINNATSIVFGETAWLYVDQNISINWSAI